MRVQRRTNSHHGGQPELHQDVQEPRDAEANEGHRRKILFCSRNEWKMRQSNSSIVLVRPWKLTC